MFYVQVKHNQARTCVQPNSQKLDPTAVQIAMRSGVIAGQDRWHQLQGLPSSVSWIIVKTWINLTNITLHCLYHNAVGDTNWLTGTQAWKPWPQLTRFPHGSLCHEQFCQTFTKESILRPPSLVLAFLEHDVLNKVQWYKFSVAWFIVSWGEASRCDKALCRDSNKWGRSAIYKL